MDKLSVIIPARNELFLQKTIDCVFSSAEEDIEVIAILDGYWPEIPIKDNPRLVLLHYTESIGQRAAINRAAKIATGKYIMKLDAHCNVGPGFDRILKADCEYSWTMVPRMYNLDITTFQPKTARHKTTDYMFISSPTSTKPFRASYYDSSCGISGLKQPFNDSILIDDIMCCMGPGWFMHKDRFFEQEGCDENHGGWGQQGIEVSCKAWLSGGALKVNKKTWFSHWFRGGGVPEGFKSGFPYELKGRAVDKARKYSQDLWLNDKWHLAERKFQWMVDKFKPPTWEICTEDDNCSIIINFKDETPSHSQEITFSHDLSIIIPSYKDPNLHKTIRSILDNFTSDYEIIPVIDGYELERPLVDDPRIHPIYLKENQGMRNAINAGVKSARGQYLMRTDEHCMFCRGFDRIILDDIKNEQIVTARRYFLDPKKWEIIQEHGYVDYEKLIIKEDPKKFSSCKWKSRTKDRINIMIDETMAWQGSMWMMSKYWWDHIIIELQTEGYGPHYQDTTEMLFKTWKAGGKLILNKNAWFAHKHRSFNRSHQYNTSRAKPEWLYALNKWYNDYEDIKIKWKI